VAIPISGSNLTTMRGTKVLFIDTVGALIVSRYNKIYRITDDIEVLICKLPISLINSFCSKSKLYYRAKRLGVGASIEYESAYYLVFESKIYRYDLNAKKLTVDFSFPEGRGPLHFTIIKSIAGFEDGLYFGEYISNRNKKPISIFFRDTAWRPIYTFESGMINHIHSLVIDDARNSVWILTGDFENAAAIFNAKDGFTNVETIVAGHQIYRACVAFPTEEGLLYATDSQIEPNSIRMLKNEVDGWQSIFLNNLNGSCIYGCELNDYYVFSTSTEPTEVVKSKMHSLFDNKPAPNINQNRSDIVTCRKSDFDVRVVYSVAKDIFPYRPFQFGTIMFPSGNKKQNTIYGYKIGAVNGDLDTVILTCEST
jgi:hypothetical protein